MGEYVFGGVLGSPVLRLGHDEKRNDTSNQDEDVENDIRSGHLFQPVCRQGVD